MLPELGATFGISPATASFSLTAYLLPFAALQLVSGTLGERWGRRRTVLAGYALYAVASVLCAVATAWPLFLAARGLQGVANAFTTPLLLAALAGSAPAGRLGRALGWFGSLQAAGQTSAPFVGGLVGELDWRLGFWGVAAVAVVLGAVGMPPQAPNGAARPSLRSAMRPYVLRLGLVAAIGWGGVAGLNFLVALRLEDEFGFGAGPRGLLLTGLGVAGLLTARVIGTAVDRIGARRAVLLGAGAGVLVIAGVGLAPDVWMIATLWASGGVATQLVLVGVTMLALGGSDGNQGGAMSVVQAVRFGGVAAAPLALTPLYHADPLLAFLAPAALVAVSVPPALPPAPTARS